MNIRPNFRNSVMSNSQVKAARVTHAHPDVYSTKELVHKDLLKGKDNPHNCPSTIDKNPHRNNPMTFLSTVNLEIMRCPASEKHRQR